MQIHQFSLYLVDVERHFIKFHPPSSIAVSRHHFLIVAPLGVDAVPMVLAWVDAMAPNCKWPVGPIVEEKLLKLGVSHQHDKHMCVSIFILKFIYTYYVFPTIDCTFLRASGALHCTSLISKLLWLSADGRSGKLSHFSVSRRSSFQTSIFSTLYSSGVVYCQTRVSTDIAYNHMSCIYIYFTFIHLRNFRPWCREQLCSLTSLPPCWGFGMLRAQHRAFWNAPCSTKS